MDQKPQAAPNTGHEGSGTEALELEQKPTGSEFYGEIVSVEETARRQKLEQRVKRKLDFIILPLLSTVYFLAQMGRSDLGNAKIAGMEEELKLTAREYSNLASIFLVGYLAFQLPGTLLVRKVGPPLQFASAMFCWGVFTTSVVGIHNYGSLMVLRTFVGCSEAFVQGAVFYLSFWYTYSELATRGAIFYSTSALAGSFNGLLAYAIQLNLDGTNGWSAWRWIFFIEGLVPMGWAFVVFFFLPRTPETAPSLYFTPEEKEVLVSRSRSAQNTGESKIQPKLILKLLIDPKFWLLSCVDMGTHFCSSSLSHFLPDILEGFGWSSVKSQLMTVIVYSCAFVWIIVSARVADKLDWRGLVICINACIAVGAYAMLIGLTSNVGRFVATCLAAASTYPNVVLVLSWTAINNPGYTYRASAAAIVNIVSQCLAISGNQAYADPPLYRTGNSAALSLMALSCVCSIVLMLHLKRENKKKMENVHSEEATRLRQFTVDEISHRHPDILFRL